MMQSGFVKVDMTLFSAAALLFLVLDPLGNIPIFLSVLKRVPKIRRWKVVLRESVIAYCVLLFFFFFGRYILEVLGLEQPSLGVAGGVILFIIAIRMIFPGPHGAYLDDEREPFIVPLAIPLISGPSAIATVLLFMADEPTRIFELLIAITCAWAASTLILVSSSYFHRFLGERGLVAMERLMGMILTTIAVQMLMTGIRQFLSQSS